MAAWFISTLIIFWVLISLLLLVALCKTAARLEKMEDDWILPDEKLTL